VADVLILGATGRFASLVAVAVAAGHRVRAATRDPGSAAGLALAARGVEVARVDLDDPSTIAAAASGIDAVFAAGTAHRAGSAADVRHGRHVVDAAREAGVAHLVYVSVAGADRPTGVPLLESKRTVEEHVAASGVPSTIIAPVYFMENLWNPWNLPVLAAGRFPTPVPRSRMLQQVSIGDVVELTTYVLGRADELARERIEVAADELTASDAAEVVAGLTGRTSLDIDANIDRGPPTALRVARPGRLRGRHQGPAAGLPGDRLAQLRDLGGDAGLVDPRRRRNTGSCRRNRGDRTGRRALGRGSRSAIRRRRQSVRSCGRLFGLPIEELCSRAGRERGVPVGRWRGQTSTSGRTSTRRPGDTGIRAAIWRASPSLPALMT
jgi:uncharacterized protein YbjT (DUF2867 family)